MLPTFVVIGAYKAGTSSLFEYLRVHPDVFMPAQKEVHFFTDDGWRRGIEWYESLFAEAGRQTARGEASPGYSAWPTFPNVPERMAQVLPSARLIYLLRHPVERLISSYRQDAHSWALDRPPEEALLDEDRQLSRSRYAQQIERYLRYFPREQLLLLTTDELQDQPVQTLAKVFRFIDVDPAFVPANLTQVYNRGEDLRSDRMTVDRLRGSGVQRVWRAAVPARVRHHLWRRLGSRPVDPALVGLSISDDLRREIVDRLRPDLVRLRDHLGPTFPCWGLLEDPLAR